MNTTVMLDDETLIENNDQSMILNSSLNQSMLYKTFVASSPTESPTQSPSNNIIKKRPQSPVISNPSSPAKQLGTVQSTNNSSTTVSPSANNNSGRASPKLSSRSVREQLHNFVEVLKNPEAHWSGRLDSLLELGRILSNIRSPLLGEKKQENYLTIHLEVLELLKTVLPQLLCDLRSSIVKAACNVLSILVETLGDKFSAHSVNYIPSLLKMHMSAISAMSSASRQCIEIIMQHPRSISKECYTYFVKFAEESLKFSDSFNRKCAILYWDTLLNLDNSLASQSSVIITTLKLMMLDEDTDVQTKAGLLFDKIAQLSVNYSVQKEEQEEKIVSSSPDTDIPQSKMKEGLVKNSISKQTEDLKKDYTSKTLQSLQMRKNAVLNNIGNLESNQSIDEKHQRVKILEDQHLLNTKIIEDDSPIYEIGNNDFASLVRIEEPNKNTNHILEGLASTIQNHENSHINLNVNSIPTMKTHESKSNAESMAKYTEQDLEKARQDGMQQAQKEAQIIAEELDESEKKYNHLIREKKSLEQQIIQYQKAMEASGLENISLQNNSSLAVQYKEVQSMHTNLLVDHKNLESTHSSLKQKFEELKAQSDKLKHSEEKHLEKIQEQQTTIQNLEVKYEKLKQQAEKKLLISGQEIQKLKEEVSVLKKKEATTNDLIQQLTEAKESLVEKDSIINKLKVEVTKLKTNNDKYDQARKQYNQMVEKNNSLESTIQKLNSNITQCEHDMKEEKKKHNLLQEELQELRKRNEIFQKTVQDFHSETQMLKATIYDKEVEITNLKKGFNADSTLNEEYNHLKELYEAKKKENAELMQICDELLTKIESSKSKT